MRSPLFLKKKVLWRSASGLQSQAISAALSSWATSSAPTWRYSPPSSPHSYLHCGSADKALHGEAAHAPVMEPRPWKIHARCARSLKLQNNGESVFAAICMPGLDVLQMFLAKSRLKQVFSPKFSLLRDSTHIYTAANKCSQTTPNIRCNRLYE